ncbi:MAG: hypothetical protein RIF32_09005, partial [Leptospirales bacterium]
MKALLTAGLVGAMFTPIGELSAQTPAVVVLEEPVSGRPIADARVVVLETGVAGFTDGNGRFAFTVPAPGYYTFRLVLPGADVRQIRRNIRFSGETLALLATAPTEGGSDTTPPESEGIAIVGLKDQTKLSRFRFSRDEIKRLPGVYGDS